MLDYQEGRAWADHHEAFGAWVGQLPGQIRGAFDALARIQYAAPWQVPEACVCDATTVPASRNDASA